MFLHDTGATELLLRIGLLRGYESPMPGQESVRRHDRCNLVQSLQPKELCLGCKPSALIVCETDPLAARRGLFMEWVGGTDPEVEAEAKEPKYPKRCA